jgi:hypothetical protein
MQRMFSNWKSTQFEIGIYVLAGLCLAGIATGTVVLRRAYTAAVASTNQIGNAAIGGESGIDVHGKRIVAQPPPTELAALLVMLHGARVDEELSYWDQVARLLDRDHVRVVAYCDSKACVDGALGRASTGPLTIAAYTEAANFYTIVAHDRIGECVLRSEEWLFPKYIPCVPTKDVTDVLANRIRQRL